MSDALDPQAQARVDEITGTFRESVPLAEPPPPGALDTSDTRGKELTEEPFREPVTDPRRHPFEVYVTGYTSADQDHAKVFVAWGTVLSDEANIAGIFPIAHLDDSFTLADGDWIWLECVFQLDGTITSLDLKSGGTWADYPALFADDGASGNTWYYPIAQVRAMLTGKSTGDHADSGEFPEIDDGFKIAQLAHTHLVKRRECSGDDLTRLWKLVPGPGGGIV